MSLSNLERAFIDRVKISRLIKTADSYGGYTKTETLLQKSVPARLYADQGSLEREIAGQTFRASYKMMLSHEVNVKVADIITAEDGNRYIVLAVRSYRTLLQNHHQTLDLGTYSEETI